MSTKNLTRDEARHRSENIAVHRYHVTLDIRQATDPHTSRFRSTTKVRFKSQVTETFLDLLDAGVESVVIMTSRFRSSTTGLVSCCAG